MIESKQVNMIFGHSILGINVSFVGGTAKFNLVYYCIVLLELTSVTPTMS